MSTRERIASKKINRLVNKGFILLLGMRELYHAADPMTLQRVNARNGINARYVRDCSTERLIDINTLMPI